MRKAFPDQEGTDEVLVFDGLSLSVRDREFVCLLGESGCGKSTLLNMVGGLDRDFSGHLALEGNAGPDSVKTDPRIGYVFQEHRLLPWLSVYDNLKFVLRTGGIPSDLWSSSISLWLDRVGLWEFRNAYPHQLSGGMRQRVSIARAFVIDPDILLMDEPFSGLDEFTGRQMREELLQLWRQSQKTVLFVTHNCFEACYLADRILILGNRPARVTDEVPVDIPRDYESEELFERSVGLTRKVLGTGLGRLRGQS
ncbi:MAG: ATP-binding cassette domain-containing protein [Streptosporangiales bacterium]|nr:ATP-binding cassette domain-containing protein [Streptosporangiales bacterium]